MTYSYGFYFAQPWWLVACLLLVPIIWLGRRYLAALGPVRRVLAIVLRCLVTLILIALLARPILSRRSERVTLIPVIDRSQSIPVTHQEASLDYLEKALASKVPRDQLAVVDVAEAPSISKLPSGDITVRRRNTTLTGGQTNLADGVQMAMAIAPPDTAVRILLVSEGNETSGDLKEAARTAAANKIPIDVLRVRYQYGGRPGAGKKWPDRFAAVHSQQHGCHQRQAVAQPQRRTGRSRPGLFGNRGAHRSGPRCQRQDYFHARRHARHT
ncbi:MAG: vWA domain-containing protein [Planctomycetota bacterium]